MAELICLGAINWDINLFMERLPRHGEEVPVKEIQRVSGGTAAMCAGFEQRAISHRDAHPVQGEARHGPRRALRFRTR